MYYPYRNNWETTHVEVTDIKGSPKEFWRIEWYQSKVSGDIYWMLMRWECVQQSPTWVPLHSNTDAQDLFALMEENDV